MGFVVGEVSEEIEAELTGFQFKINRARTKDSVDLQSGYVFTPGNKLPVCSVLSRSGQVVGHVLGYSIDLSSERVLTGALTIDEEFLSSPNVLAEHVLMRLGGKFVFLLCHMGELRGYVDCAAQLPMVVDHRTKQVGSSAAVLLDPVDYEERFDKELFDIVDLRNGGWFPGGLTAHFDVERVLANHYFDFLEWEIVRFWPHNAQPEMTVESVANVVVDTTMRHYRAIAGSDKKLCITLTGGDDTRMLMACGRSVAHDADFLTILPPTPSHVDAVIPEKLALKFGVNHIKVPRLEATKPETSDYVLRAGHTYADNNSRYFVSTKGVGSSHIVCTGLGGEVARGFYWRNSDVAETSVSSELLLGRAGLPSHPRLIESLDHWLAGLPKMSRLEILDLFYSEQRMSCWYGVQGCSNPYTISVAPMYTVATTRAMLALGNKAKFDSALTGAIISQTWPELAETPTNTLGVVRDLANALPKALQLKGRIVKKVRKLTS